MLKHVLLSATLAGALAGTALAADVPANTDDCLEQARNLANSVAEKKVDDSKLESIEGLLTKMEDACDAKKFEEAASAAKELEAAIGG